MRTHVVVFIFVSQSSLLYHYLENNCTYVPLCPIWTFSHPIFLIFYFKLIIVLADDVKLFIIYIYIYCKNDYKMI